MKLELELTTDEINTISAALNNDALVYLDAALEDDDKEVCLDYLESYVKRMRLMRMVDNPNSSSKAKLLYSWDDLYELADGCGYGDHWLTAKDEARWQLGRYILETEGYEIEDAECPEEEIDSYLSDHEKWFDENGNLMD